jgi:hypothetical protein
MAGFCKRDNKPSDSMEVEELTEDMNDCSSDAKGCCAELCAILLPHRHRQ